MNLEETHPELNIYKIIDEFGDKWEFLDMEEVSNNTISKKRLIELLRKHTTSESIIRVDNFVDELGFSIEEVYGWDE